MKLLFLFRRPRYLTADSLVTVDSRTAIQDSLASQLKTTSPCYEPCLLYLIILYY